MKCDMLSEQHVLEMRLSEGARDPSAGLVREPLILRERAAVCNVDS